MGMVRPLCGAPDTRPSHAGNLQFTNFLKPQGKILDDEAQAYGLCVVQGWAACLAGRACSSHVVPDPGLPLPD